MSAWAHFASQAIPSYPELSPDDQDRLANIDWSGEQVKQVFQGQLNPSDAEETASLVFPVVVLYVSSVEHDGLEKFQSYSGTVDFVLDFTWTWSSSGPRKDYETVLDATEDVVLSCLHDQGWIGSFSGMTYTGENSIIRSPLSSASRNWQQSITFQFRYGVDI